MKWESKHIDLGNIPANRSKTITFKALEDFGIDRISTSCGCISAKYNREKKELNIKFSPGSIPRHLIGINRYSTIKTINLRYSDSTLDTLSFKATITKR